MPVAGSCVEQFCNAQAVVNNERQVVPMLEREQALPTGQNKPDQSLTDTDACSADNVAAFEQASNC